MKAAVGVVRCSLVRALFATLLMGVALGILPGCAIQHWGNGQAGPPAGNGSLEIILIHEVAPWGFLVEDSKAYLVTENEGRFAIVEVSLPDGKERVLVEDTAQNVAVSRDGNLRAYGPASEWNASCEVRLFDLDKATGGNSLIPQDLCAAWFSCSLARLSSLRPWKASS